MHTDRYGLPLSTSSNEAAEAYRDGIDLLLSAWPGAAEALDAAIAADPAFALAHIARGRIHQMYAEGAQARQKATTARHLAPACTARERTHIEALASAIEGQPAHAIAVAEMHLETVPRDAVVLAMLLGAFGLYAFSGRADHDAARVAICERHARHYGQDWWFLTYLGWSHTEAGNAGAGRVLAEHALALRRANANGAHALSHALFEQGELGAATAFMDDWLPSYDRTGILNGHLCWHLALSALDEGDTGRALHLYNERIKPAVSHAAPLNLFTDAASLLWRIELAGGARSNAAWGEIATYAERMFPKPGLAFADLHRVLAASATGSPSPVREIEALAAQNKLVAGSGLVDLVRGLQAFGAGDFAGAIASLEAAAADTVRIGGSHAQRELCEDTLIVALMRDGQSAKARSLIDRRLHRRPSMRDSAWRSRL
jgi:hypothetical protein